MLEFIHNNTNNGGAHSHLPSEGTGSLGLSNTGPSSSTDTRQSCARRRSQSAAGGTAQNRIQFRPGRGHKPNHKAKPGDSGHATLPRSGLRMSYHSEEKRASRTKPDQRAPSCLHFLAALTAATSPRPARVCVTECARMWFTAWHSVRPRLHTLTPPPFLKYPAAPARLLLPPVSSLCTA